MSAPTLSAWSLRSRLTVIILLPLIAVAAIAGIWQLNNARTTAEEVFDRALLSAALAVANDVTVSGGDAISLTTRDLLADTSGGRVFYHVYAPDGVIVAGYATPPVGIPRNPEQTTGQAYFDATYQGREVRGVRLQNQAQIDGFAGVFTTTVWQDRSVRTGFVRDLVLRTIAVISALICSLALIVWFGVRIGLRPLSDLQEAIGQRSSDELSAIQRPVPEEVVGIVGTLNRLFDQVSRTMTAQSEFIGNAAHQLRNPIAGVLSLAEAVHSASDYQSAQTRSADLLSAARETADLSQKLLMLERASTMTQDSARSEVAVADELEAWVDAFRESVPEGVSVELEVTGDPGTIDCDPVMLREAIRNMLDNAITHGGPALSEITVGACRSGGWMRIWVQDNGVGIPADALDAARERFRQIAPTSRSGLGMSIIEAVAESHGGSLTVTPTDPGLRVEISIGS